MEIFTELKNLVGYTGTDYDFIFIFFSLMIIWYILNQLFSLFGVMIHWKGRL